MTSRARVLGGATTTVLVVLIVWWLAVDRWRALHAVYGTTLDTSEIRGRWTVSVTDANRATWSTYAEAVAARFSADAIELWQRAPLGLVFRPLSVPATAISRCGRFDRGAGIWVASLWLAREELWLDFESGRDDALEWCQARGLPLVDEVQER
jgi:hypothetical protein